VDGSLHKAMILLISGAV